MKQDVFRAQRQTTSPVDFHDDLGHDRFKDQLDQWKVVQDVFLDEWKRFKEELSQQG